MSVEVGNAESAGQARYQNRLALALMDQ